MSGGERMSSGGDVFVGRSMKVNMGNYESLGIDVGLRLPIEEGETPQQAILRVTKIVTEELNQRLGDVEKAKGKGGG